MILTACAHGGARKVDHSADSGKELCSDCRTFIYHQRNDVVAIRDGSLEVSLQGVSEVQCMEWQYRRSGYRQWT